MCAQFHLPSLQHMQLDELRLEHVLEVSIIIFIATLTISLNITIITQQYIH